MLNEGWGIDLDKLNIPFEDQWEMMQEFMSLLDVRIYYLYKYHMWVGPENNLQNMMGLAISRAEFEMNLSRAVDAVIGLNLENEEIADIEALSGYFSIRMKKTYLSAPELPVLQLFKKFSLDEFAQNCLLLAFAVQLDKKYERIFAFLQDDITKKIPTADTAIKLFALPGEKKADYFYYFTAESVLTRYLLLESEENSSLFGKSICLRSRFVDYLMENKSRFDTGYLELYEAEAELPPLIASDLTDRSLDLALASPQLTTGEAQGIVLISVTGQKGSGRKFQVKHAIRRKRGKCLFVNMKVLLEASGALQDKLQEIICEAILSDAYLCFADLDSLLGENNSKERFEFIAGLTQNMAYLPKAIFMTAELIWKETHLPHRFIKVDIQIEPTDESKRLQLWQNFMRNLNLAGDIDLEELSSKFKFTPGQIRNSVLQASGLCELNGLGEIDAVTLHKCCYAQVVMRLDTLASKVKPAYTWEDLVLPGDQVELLQEACSHVKYRHTVYQHWGFDRKVSYGKGLSMLFSGPPGTGKTMAAQVIANQLHMEMYKIQLSQVVSKYIGETEKNLRQVFEEAKNANCILFFDETDALFGKRSEVKDSHDRHANIETAYLLQQIEEYDGVIVMATNLLQNIDNAFMRRINFVIAFPFPDVLTRRELWAKLLDTSAPLSEDINLDFMAGQFKLAGGNIKNIVIHAAFQAAAEKSPISMKHLLKSAVNEQRKNNIIIVKEDLKEYANLVFQ